MNPWANQLIRRSWRSPTRRVLCFEDLVAESDAAVLLGGAAGGRPARLLIWAVVVWHPNGIRTRVASLKVRPGIGRPTWADTGPRPVHAGGPSVTACAPDSPYGRGGLGRAVNLLIRRRIPWVRLVLSSAVLPGEVCGARSGQWRRIRPRDTWWIAKAVISRRPRPLGRSACGRR